MPTSSRAGRSTSSHSATPRRRHVTATLHLLTEDLLAPGGSADQTEHRIIIRGHLAEIWADARARAAVAPPGVLANSYTKQITGVSFSFSFHTDQFGLVSDPLPIITFAVLGGRPGYEPEARLCGG